MPSVTLNQHYSTVLPNGCGDGKTKCNGISSTYQNGYHLTNTYHYQYHQARVPNASKPISPSVRNDSRSSARSGHNIIKPRTTVLVLTIICNAILVVFGYLRELLKYLRVEFAAKAIYVDSPKNKDFVPLYNDFENFFTRYLYMRIRDCWNRPVCGVPGAEVDLMERVSHDYNLTYEYLKGVKKDVINLGSYNYMGFAETNGPCYSYVHSAVHQHGLATASARREIGSLKLQRELERLVSEFVGKPDAIVFQMGFATNSMNLPALIRKGCLIVSDSQNHASLILGSRLSRSNIRVFTHGDMASLEKILRSAVIKGQPRTGRPWKKIIIIVEGVYSMEGTIINLPEVIRLKKKYKAYLYVDEAHSIGSLGIRAGGVVQYWGCDPNDVDILMGTFTKSFGAAGGYIAASTNIINYLRLHSHDTFYGVGMSPPVIQQIISAIHVLTGRIGGQEGAKRIRQLADNVVYFRQRLKSMGFIIYGDDDSPVVPLLIYYPTKCACFSREALLRGLGVVVVGFPATPIFECRARFCLSSAHTREMLDKALDIIDKVGDETNLKYQYLKHI